MTYLALCFTIFLKVELHFQSHFDFHKKYILNPSPKFLFYDQRTYSYQYNVIQQNKRTPSLHPKQTGTYFPHIPTPIQ